MANFDGYYPKSFDDDKFGAFPMGNLELTQGGSTIDRQLVRTAITAGHVTTEQADWTLEGDQDFSRDVVVDADGEPAAKPNAYYDLGRGGDF